MGVEYIYINPLAWPRKRGACLTSRAPCEQGNISALLQLKYVRSCIPVRNFESLGVIDNDGVGHLLSTDTHYHTLGSQAISRSPTPDRFLYHCPHLFNLPYEPTRRIFALQVYLQRCPARLRKAVRNEIRRTSPSYPTTRKLQFGGFNFIGYSTICAMVTRR